MDSRPTHTLKLSSGPEVRTVDCGRGGEILEVKYTAIPLEGKGGKEQKVDLLDLDAKDLQKILDANPTGTSGEEGPELPNMYTMQVNQSFEEWEKERVLEWGKTLASPPGEDEDEDGYRVEGIGGLRVGKEKALQVGTVWGDFNYSAGEGQITWNSVEAIAGAPGLVGHYLGAVLLNDVEVKIEGGKVEGPKKKKGTKVKKVGKGTGGRKGVKKGEKQVGKVGKAEKPKGKGKGKKTPSLSGKQVARMLGKLSKDDISQLAGGIAKKKRICDKFRIGNNNNNKWD